MTGDLVVLTMSSAEEVVLWLGPEDDAARVVADPRLAFTLGAHFHLTANEADTVAEALQGSAVECRAKGVGSHE